MLFRSESNNVGKSASFTIGRPDLRVSSVTLENPDGIYAYNGLLSAVAAIENAGGGSTLPQAPLGFNVSFYLGAVDADTDEERMLYSLHDAVVLWLDGGQSTTDNLNTLLLPAQFPPGEYRVWVRADSADEIDESIENNNWRSSGVLTIQGARWEDEAGRFLDGTIPEAQPVYLAVYTGEVSTASSIPVQIWEDDVSFGDAGNDFLETVTLKHVQIGRASWRVRV